MKISILTTNINFPSHYSHLTYDYYAILFNLIKEVKKELRIATFLIDAKILSIIEKDLLKKNKEVKLIIDKKNSSEVYDLIKDLQKSYSNFSIKVWKDEAKTFHPKLLIFDDQKVIIGSHNLTYGAYALNIEISLLIEDDTKDTVSKFIKVFDYIFKNIDN